MGAGEFVDEHISCYVRSIITSACIGVQKRADKLIVLFVGSILFRSVKT